MQPALAQRVVTVITCHLMHDKYSKSFRTSVLILFCCGETGCRVSRLRAAAAAVAATSSVSTTSEVIYRSVSLSKTDHPAVWLCAFLISPDLVPRECEIYWQLQFFSPSSSASTRDVRCPEKEPTVCLLASALAMFAPDEREKRKQQQRDSWL